MFTLGVWDKRSENLYRAFASPQQRIHKEYFVHFGDTRFPHRVQVTSIIAVPTHQNFLTELDFYIEERIVESVECFTYNIFGRHIYIDVSYNEVVAHILSINPDAKDSRGRPLADGTGLL